MLQGFMLIIISCFMSKRIHELFFISNPKLLFLLIDSHIPHFGSMICYYTFFELYCYHQSAPIKVSNCILCIYSIPWNDVTVWSDNFS